MIEEDIIYFSQLQYAGLSRIDGHPIFEVLQMMQKNL